MKYRYEVVALMEVTIEGSTSSRSELTPYVERALREALATYLGRILHLLVKMEVEQGTITQVEIMEVAAV